MQSKTALKVILIISIAGILFSGYLSYLELFSPTGCSLSPISCGTTNFTIASLPACVYGFVMYAVVFVISILGLAKKEA